MLLCFVLFDFFVLFPCFNAFRNPFGMYIFPFLEASFSAALVFNDVFKDEFTDLAKGTDGFRFPDPYNWLITIPITVIEK